MACIGVTPDLRWPTVSKTQRSLRVVRSFPPSDGCSTSGTNIAGLKNSRMPLNAGGETPRMVKGWRLSRTTRPTTVRSSWKWVCQ